MVCECHLQGFFAIICWNFHFLTLSRCTVIINRKRIHEMENREMKLMSLLKEKQLSVYQCAKESHVPYTTLSDMVKGKTRIEKCTVETIYKLARTLQYILFVWIHIKIHNNTIFTNTIICYIPLASIIYRIIKICTYFCNIHNTLFL